MSWECANGCSCGVRHTWDDGHAHKLKYHDGQSVYLCVHCGMEKDFLERKYGFNRIPASPGIVDWRDE